jgi:hypothetical protein
MVKRKDADLSSSNKITVFLRAGKNSGVTQSAQPHEEFANLKDDDQSIEQFTRRWGKLTGDERPMIDAAPIAWQDMLRKAWQGDSAALKEVQSWGTRYMVASLSFSDGRLEMESKYLIGSIFILFLRDHLAGKTAVCENENCEGQRFFIKAKATQKFCGHPKCTAFAQKQYALKWWNEEGKQLREKRRKKAQRKAGK